MTLPLFSAHQITMPKDNLHWGGVEHRSLHNQNGALFHQATAEVRCLSRLAAASSGRLTQKP